MEDNKPIIKASTPNSKKYDTKIDIYTSDPKGPHDSIHIAVDSDTKTAHIIDTTNGDTEHTDVGCYLTTACMRHYNKDFDDNCEELSILRWFRDKFVLPDDIMRYYATAPSIVATINSLETLEKRNNIYNYIYNSVVKYCVEAIKKGDYDKAYSRYKAMVLTLEDQFLSIEEENTNRKSIMLVKNNY